MSKTDKFLAFQKLNVPSFPGLKLRQFLTKIKVWKPQTKPSLSGSIEKSLLISNAQNSELNKKSHFYRFPTVLMGTLQNDKMTK